MSEKDDSQINDEDHSRYVEHESGKVVHVVASELALSETLYQPEGLQTLKQSRKETTESSEGNLSSQSLGEANHHLIDHQAQTSQTVQHAEEVIEEFFTQYDEQIDANELVKKWETDTTDLMTQERYQLSSSNQETLQADSDLSLLAEQAVVDAHHLTQKSEHIQLTGDSLIEAFSLSSVSSTWLGIGSEQTFNIGAPAEEQKPKYRRDLNRALAHETGVPMSGEPKTADYRVVDVVYEVMSRRLYFLNRVDLQTLTEAENQLTAYLSKLVELSQQKDKHSAYFTHAQPLYLNAVYQHLTNLQANTEQSQLCELVHISVMGIKFVGRKALDPLLWHIAIDSVVDENGVIDVDKMVEQANQNLPSADSRPITLVDIERFNFGQSSLLQWYAHGTEAQKDDSQWSALGQDYRARLLHLGLSFSELSHFQTPLATRYSLADAFYPIDYSPQAKTAEVPVRHYALEEHAQHWGLFRANNVYQAYDCEVIFESDLNFKLSEDGSYFYVQSTEDFYQPLHQHAQKNQLLNSTLYWTRADSVQTADHLLYSRDASLRTFELGVLAKTLDSLPRLQADEPFKIHFHKGSWFLLLNHSLLFSDAEPKAEVTPLLYSFTSAFGLMSFVYYQRAARNFKDDGLFTEHTLEVFIDWSVDLLIQGNIATASLEPIDHERVLNGINTYEQQLDQQAVD